MPQNITDVATFTSPIQSVADGDAANGANFLLAPQGLANRTAYLNAILGTNGNGTGITSIRQGSAATMTALTGQTTGAVFLVNQNAATPTVQGLYVFDASSTLTTDNAFVYAASGGGQWVHELFSLINVNKGLAGIGPIAGGSAAANRLLASVVPNGFFQLPTVSTITAAFTTTSTTYVDVTSLGITVANCVAGDQIGIDYVAPVTTNTAGGYVGTIVAVVDGGSTVTIAHSSCTSPTASGAANFLYNLVGTARYTVVNSGTITVKLQALSDSGAHTATVAPAASNPATLRTFIVRP